MTAASPPPIYIRACDVKARFGFHRSTLYRWSKAGLITIHTFGSCSFVKTADVEALIEKGSRK